jgi:transposase InsO family protein
VNIANPERHEYELYLAIEDIDHSRTKTKSPQTNGICERFHKTVLNEFYRRFPQEGVSFNRRAANRSGFLGQGIQRDATTSGPLVLRQNPDADLPGCNADDEGEDDRSLTVSDSKTRSLNQAPTVRSNAG